ncbi:MAG: gamma carbonic anhydrase family protein [Microthrixaceae bacterium]|nr:gamma carbonic anhydrase family protein [Microthrixaceae bacterium]
MPIYALGDQVPEIHADAYIHPDAVVIGNVVIGANSSVWPSAVLRGDDGFIFVGERCSIQDGAVLHTTAVFPTTIGNDVTVGHLAHLEGCVVEDKALIGSGSIVLHNARIGVEAVVGGGAFVKNNQIVPPLAMALGVPAVVKEGVVRPGHFDMGVESYVKRAQRFAKHLRRID